MRLLAALGLDHGDAEHEAQRAHQQKDIRLIQALRLRDEERSEACLTVRVRAPASDQEVEAGHRRVTRRTVANASSESVRECLGLVRLAAVNADLQAPHHDAIVLTCQCPVPSTGRRS